MVLVLLLAGSQGARAQNISTVAGNGDTGTLPGDGGLATAAPLNRPLDVARASNGDLLIADYGDGTIPGGHNRIRRVDAAGIITTIAGNGTPDGPPGPPEFGDGGSATAAALNGPISVAVDTFGAGLGDVYIADYYHDRVRRVDADTGVIEAFAVTGVNGFLGDTLPATEAWLARPAGLAIDAEGNVFIADQGNHVIRRVDTAGVITTVAGSPNNGGYNGDGPAATTMLSAPYGLTFDLDGNLVICDQGNYRVRRLNLTTGMIGTIAGSGVGVGPEGVLAINAGLAQPRDVAYDASGNLYIADGEGSDRVWRVDADTEVISIVAGTGTPGFSGDAALATTSRLNRPSGLAVSVASGELYIADIFNYRIRRIEDLQGSVPDDDCPASLVS